MGRILLFNVEKDKKARIRFLAMRLGIFTLEVQPEDFGKTLAAITGREKGDQAKRPVLPFSGEMLVMDELEPHQFHGLLDGMRSVGAGIALKAVVTEQNLIWTPAELYRELSAEHEAILQSRKNTAHRI